MAKPTFLFVPGAWSTPAVFDLLTTALTTHDYRTQTISLPSVGANPGLHDFSADVTAVREAVTTLANEGKDVIVVMHSYGGMPGSEALEGLGKEEREAKGKTGGVVRLVYIMSYAVPEGWQFTERGNLDAFPEWQDIDAKTGTITLPPSTAHNLFFHDLPPIEAARQVSLLQTQSIGVFWSKTTYAAWRHIPSTYVLCEGDRALPIAAQEAMLEKCRQEGGRFDVVERCGPSFGHFVFLSRVEWVVGVLRKAAGEEVSEEGEDLGAGEKEVNE